jgi:hypothetical protein
MKILARLHDIERQLYKGEEYFHLFLAL